MTRIFRTLVFVLGFAALSAFAASEPTLHQIYEAARAGRTDDAQTMMTQVLQAHPNSAKAHYVQAELHAQQQRYDLAREELTTAEKLEPGLSFAKPESVRKLKARIERTALPSAANPYSAPPPAKSFPIGALLVLVGSVVVVIWIVRAMRRRTQTYYPVGGNAQPMPGNPSGMGGMPMGQGPQGPMGGAGGGIGSGILGGLATGAAVGAGVVAGEALMHHLLDKDNSAGSGLLPDANAMPIEQTSRDDLGGSDFGISGGGWDDGGGDVGGAGGDDW